MYDCKINKLRFEEGVEDATVFQGADEQMADADDLAEREGAACSAHHVDWDSPHLARHHHAENGEAHVNGGDGGQKKVAAK